MSSVTVSASRRSGPGSPPIGTGQPPCPSRRFCKSLTFAGDMTGDGRLQPRKTWKHDFNLDCKRTASRGPSRRKLRGDVRSLLWTGYLPGPNGQAKSTDRRYIR